MTQLTEGQWHALRNLERKRGGDEVAFVNIADAQLLVERGFAVRSRQGWDITPEGRQALARGENNDTET